MFFIVVIGNKNEHTYRSVLVKGESITKVLETSFNTISKEGEEVLSVSVSEITDFVEIVDTTPLEIVEQGDGRQICDRSQ